MNETTPLLVVSEEACVLEEHESDQLEDMKIKYISEGAWISRMIVSFFLDGKKTTQQVSGSGKFVTIPSRARDIEVKFQVRRPFWGDVMKCNRLERPGFNLMSHMSSGTKNLLTVRLPSAVICGGKLLWESPMNTTMKQRNCEVSVKLLEH